MAVKKQISLTVAVSVATTLICIGMAWGVNREKTVNNEKSISRIENAIIIIQADVKTLISRGI